LILGQCEEETPMSQCVTIRRVIAVAAIWMASWSSVVAQTGTAPQRSDSSGAKEGQAIKPEQLEQLVAPIALHPDALVSQILMASTYPLEIVQADRWARKNESLKGDALTTALEKETWDPSVKSLVNFPQILAMMSEKLDWTTSLGDAFLGQQKEVMAAIQKLRARAKSEGNLESTNAQTVVVKEEAQTQVIVIESSDPEVIYVPTYNPTVVYGAWPYPAYPPYNYYPPGYVAGTAAISFGAGVACGAAWGYAWGGCNWGQGDVDIDVDRNTFVNNNIDRSRYKTEIGSRNRNLQNGRGSWQHDPSHRKGAAYRDSATANRFGGASAADTARSRDAYRGRAEAGRQEISRGGADSSRGGPSAAANRTPGDRSSSANRQAPAGRQPSADRAGSTAPKGSAAGDRSRQPPSSRGGAFEGAGQGSSARSASQRGQSSRSSPSPSASRSSAPRGGGSYGGGASRGGGGGGRGGGGRR
jgi:hypothetical protein